MLEGASLTGSRNNTLGPIAYSSRLPGCAQPGILIPFGHSGWSLKLCSCLVSGFARGVEAKENE